MNGDGVQARHFTAIFSFLPLVVALAACSAESARTSAVKPEITVAAAANLTDAFTELAKTFESSSGIHVTLSFGSTATLAHQIENGAPFDVFAAADTEHVDQLAAKALLVPETQATYARGKLALWIPPDHTSTVNRIEDLAGPRVRFIAIAQPEAAPYGKAAMESLEKLGLRKQLQPKITYAANVNMAVQYASTGNADAAFAAYSLVFRLPGKIIEIPENLHAPLDQSLAILKQTSNLEASRRFIRFVLYEGGTSILARYGYPAQHGAQH